MATLNIAFPLVHPIFLTQRNPSPHSITLTSKSLRSTSTIVRVDANNFLGDFGARDPFPAEIESQFGDKVLGNNDTEHKILIPNIAALSLSQQNCTPVSPLQHPISEDDASKLLRKVTIQFITNLFLSLSIQCVLNCLYFVTDI